MSDLKFFVPLDGMIPAECPHCHQTIATKEDGVLLQENTAGGGNAVIHKACLEAIMQEVKS